MGKNAKKEEGHKKGEWEIYEREKIIVKKNKK